MAINFSALAGAAGKTFGDHLLEMRKAREARKAAFENQKELLGIQAGYAIGLKELGIAGELQKELIKQGGNAKKGGISFNAIPGFTSEGFNYYSSAQDARARQDDYYLATLRYLSPVIDAVNNGDISPEDALQMFRNSNNETQIGLIANARFDSHLKDRGENRAPGSATQIFGPRAAPILAPIVFQNLGSDPRAKSYGEGWNNTIGYVFGRGSTAAGTNEPLAYNLYYNNKDFLPLVQQYRDNQISSSELTQGVRTLLNRDDLSDEEVRDIIGTSLSATQPRVQIDRAGKIEDVQFTEINIKANNEQQYRTAAQLSKATGNIAVTLLTKEPIVTDIASGAAGTLANLVTGGKELFSLFKGKTVKQAFDEGLHVTVVGQIETELNSNTESDLSSSQKKEIMDIIRSSEKEIAKLDLSDEKNLATYQFHMEKLILAYTYSKFIQGGAGGNAVSNADFQNTMNALFRTYDTDPVKARRTLAIGMMNLHNSIEKYVAGQEAKTKFSFSRDGKTYFYGDDVTQRLYKDMLKEQNDLAQKGNPYEYWAYVFRKNGNNIAADQLATTAAATDEQSVPPPAPVRQGRRTTDPSSRPPRP
jgi:hypothetical protein